MERLTMKTTIACAGIPSEFNKKPEIARTPMETRLMCIPGARPVIVPIKIPSRRPKSRKRISIVIYLNN
jgi:hypothetical protein